MHGLINRALQSFVCNTYGTARWQRAMEQAGLDFCEFEAMLSYDDDIGQRVLDALCADLGRPVEDLLEDLGTYLVSNPRTESLRRLLRFGGVGYADFLHSLDDLPGRARMAVSDLRLPVLELREVSGNRYSLICAPGLPGFGCALVGVLRAMADDYGALVTLDRRAGDDGADMIDISVIETSFAAGRSFELGARAG